MHHARNTAVRTGGRSAYTRNSSRPVRTRALLPILAGVRDLCQGGRATCGSLSNTEHLVQRCRRVLPLPCLLSQPHMTRRSAPSRSLNDDCAARSETKRYHLGSNHERKAKLCGNMSLQMPSYVFGVTQTKRLCLQVRNRNNASCKIQETSEAPAQQVDRSSPEELPAQASGLNRRASPGLVIDISRLGMHTRIQAVLATSSVPTSTWTFVPSPRGLAGAAPPRIPCARVFR